MISVAECGTSSPTTPDSKVPTMLMPLKQPTPHRQKTSGLSSVHILIIRKVRQSPTAGRDWPHLLMPTRWARLATSFDAHTVTSCPIWYMLVSRVNTSTIFTFDSEALQCEATLQAAHADVCTICTLMQPSAMLFTIPECVILLLINLLSRHYILQRYDNLTNKTSENAVFSQKYS